METTKEDIRKILLLHENAENVLTHYVETKIQDATESKFINGFVAGVVTVVILLGTYLYIHLS